MIPNDNLTFESCLVQSMLDTETRAQEGIEEDGEDLDLIARMEDMNMNVEGDEKVCDVVKKNMDVIKPTRFLSALTGVASFNNN